MFRLVFKILDIYFYFKFLGKYEKGLPKLLTWQAVFIDFSM